MTQFDYNLKHIDQLHVRVSNSFLRVLCVWTGDDNKGHSFKRSLSWTKICIDDDCVKGGM